MITNLRIDLRFKLYNQENPGRLPRHHHHRRAGGRQQRARDHDRRHQEADPDGAVPAAAVRQGELLLLRGGGRGARVLDPALEHAHSINLVCLKRLRRTCNIV